MISCTIWCIINVIMAVAFWKSYPVLAWINIIVAVILGLTVVVGIMLPKQNV